MNKTNIGFMHKQRLEYVPLEAYRSLGFLTQPKASRKRWKKDGIKFDGIHEQQILQIQGKAPKQQNYSLCISDDSIYYSCPTCKISCLKPYYIGVCLNEYCRMICRDPNSGRLLDLEKPVGELMNSEFTALNLQPEIIEQYTPEPIDMTRAFENFGDYFFCRPSLCPKCRYCISMRIRETSWECPFCLVNLFFILFLFSRLCSDLNISTQSTLI